METIFVGTLEGELLSFSDDGIEKLETSREFESIRYIALDKKNEIYHVKWRGIYDSTGKPVDEFNRGWCANLFYWDDIFCKAASSHNRFIVWDFATNELVLDTGSSDSFGPFYGLNNVRFAERSPNSLIAMALDYSFVEITDEACLKKWPRSSDEVHSYLDRFGEHIYYSTQGGKIFRLEADRDELKFDIGKFRKKQESITAFSFRDGFPYILASCNRKDDTGTLLKYIPKEEKIEVV